MLKWTSLQKSAVNIQMDKKVSSKSQRKRRSTLSNKENIVTSTPLRTRPSKMLNTSQIEPFPDRSTCPVGTNTSCQYAATLPTYEEEYSPTPIIPGQLIAMRGIIPDVSFNSPKYLTTSKSDKDYQRPAKKRKIDENDQPTKDGIRTSLNSSKMGDATLDKLIDAILDSARKDKKRQPRRSFNLRKRTLLRNNPTSVLSPSYTPADDPASDLSFSEIKVKSDESKSEFKTRKKSYNKNSETLNNVTPSSYFEVGLALPSIYV